MSLKQKKPTISIPEFKKPTPPSFSAFGLTSGYNGNSYGLTEDAQALADRTQAESIRRELVSALGLKSGSMSDPYANLLADESLRIAQPRLENALIGRGLGGSSVYRGALSDLISRASTEAALASNEMKLRNLEALQSGYLLPYYQMGQNLLGLSANAGQADAAQAAAMYQALLPYTAKVNTPKESGLMGALTGGLQGFFTGGPLAALVGAGSGYMNSARPASSESYMLSDYYPKNTGLSLQNLLGLQNLAGLRGIF